MVALKPFSVGLVVLTQLALSSVKGHPHTFGTRTHVALEAKDASYPPAAGGGEGAYPAPPAEGHGAEPGHESAPAYEAPPAEHSAPAEGQHEPKPSAPEGEYPAPAPEEPAPPAEHPAPAESQYEPAPAPDHTPPAAEEHPAETTPVEWPAPDYTAPPTPTYGSGSAPNEHLDACLATCSASFGWGAAPTASASYAPPGEAGKEGGKEGSKTHTVIVAPSQGVLKFVPFAITVPPGDKIEYQWGAGPHTVTKSSQLNICNATIDKPFNSGRLNKSATFEQAVETDQPEFVFCGVQPHCVKGMFSIINPPTAPANLTAGSEAASTFDTLLTSMASNSSTVQTMVDQAKGVCGNNSDAWAWGGKMVMDQGMEEWAMMAAVENTLWTRMSFAMNPSALVDGFNLASFSVPPSFADLSGANGTTAPPSPGGGSSGSTGGSGGGGASVSVEVGGGASETSSAPGGVQTGAQASSASSSKTANTVLLSIALALCFVL